MNEDEVKTNENEESLETESVASSDNAKENPLSKQFEGKQTPSNVVHDIQAVYDVPVQVSAVIGRTTMPVHQLLKLGHGAVVELDRKIGEAIDIYVNNRLIARGELIVIDDRVGVTMTEIIKYEQ